MSANSFQTDLLDEEKAKVDLKLYSDGTVELTVTNDIYETVSVNISLQQFSKLAAEMQVTAAHLRRLTAEPKHDLDLP